MRGLLRFLRPYRKAVGGFLAASIGALGTSLLDGAFATTDLIAAVGAGLVTAAAVYMPRNAPKP